MSKTACNELFDDGAYGAQRCSRVAGHRGHHGTTASARLAPFDQTQECRDCGRRFPYDPEADRCPSCAADAIGAPVDPEWPGEDGYANRGDALSWA